MSISQRSHVIVRPWGGVLLHWQAVAGLTASLENIYQLIRSLRKDHQKLKIELKYVWLK